MQSSILILLSAMAVFAAVEGIDCRRFAFAPACRGVMVKRAQAIQSMQHELKQEDSLLLSELRRNIGDLSAGLERLTRTELLLAQRLAADSES